MKIGVLELAAYPARGLWERVDDFWTVKQYAGITAQAISVWCRQMGHEAHYVFYHGLGDPKAMLPDHLDVIFISAHTYLAPLAYALSRLYQRQGTLTVLGGAHAKSFPDDALRYFDLVVQECDKQLLADIINQQFDPPSIVSSEHPFMDVPTLEERLPEMQKSMFWRGKPHPACFVPLLASLGCPYDCDFCLDWNKPYRSLSVERLTADLQFAAQKLPGTKLVFHDPNFGVRFDEVMSIFENTGIPPQKRNPYGIECTLNSLRSDRMQRLRETNCRFVLPSIESWSTAYGNKLGVGKVSYWEKMERTVEYFKALRGQFYYIGTNFIFGLDQDSGDEPFETTKEFMLRSPHVWPILHIPIPFGNTPRFDRLLAEDRILKPLPFMFYKVPFLATTLKNYDPLTYYRQMADLFAVASSGKLLHKRLADSQQPLIMGVHMLRTVTARSRYNLFQKIVQRLEDDTHYLAFHNAEVEKLPDFYVQAYHRALGHYAEIIPIEESCYPVLKGNAVN